MFVIQDISRAFRVSSWQWKGKFQTCLSSIHKLGPQSSCSSPSGSREPSIHTPEYTPPHTGEQPPSYQEPDQLWECTFPDYLRNRKTEPREEEGCEALPPYECTVFKEGKVRLLCEFKRPNVRSTSYSWKKNVRLSLQGTMIHAYKLKKKKDPKLLWSYSMDNAIVDTPKTAARPGLRSGLLRLQIHDGPQFLIEPDTGDDVTEWSEQLQASVNISSDLDTRQTPLFRIPRRRQRRRARNQPQETAGQSASR